MTFKRYNLRKPRIYYGWVIVAVAALASFSQTAETFPLWGVLLKPMTEEFGWSRSAFTGAMTIGTIFGSVIAVAIGPMLDRFGPRWMVTAAFALIGGTLLLMAWISSLWQFYVLLIPGRMVHLGVIALAVSVIIPKWFIVKRGRATAIGGMGNRVGSAITPLYAQLMVSLVSWRAAVATVGIAVWVVSLIPVALFLRRQPEDMGLLPDGATREDMAGLGLVASTGTGVPIPGFDISLGLRQVLKLRSFYLLTAAFSVGFLVGPTTSLHLVPYFTDQGMTAGVAVAVIAVSAASSAAGSLFFGLLVERFHVRWIMAANFFLLATGFGFLLVVESALPAFLWGVYYGVAYGGMFTLLHIILADYYGRASLGAIRAFIWPAQSVTHALGPIGAAFVYDTTGGYTLVFSLFAILTLAAAFGVLAAKPPASLPVTKAD